ncbi:MAG: hypothetical protein GC191_01645 [Azospirillum sp.]|nr:hypothetical protein [Azospirillum sp.]
MQAIERVKEDVTDLTKPRFSADTRNGHQMRDAVVLNLGTMGEIADDIRKRFPDIAANHPEIPLRW